MKVLGIDPGYAIVGYGIVEQKGHSFYPITYGHVATSPKLSFFERLHQIQQELKVVIETHEPTTLSIEKIFFSKNVKTAIDVAQARGAILAQAISFGLEIFEYTPNEIKLAITGYGRAPKIQIQEMVKRLLNLKEIPKPDDTADALAIALCHCHCAKLISMTR
jgi:crossover junction endodeoxyribonuclease RuvC